MVCGALLGVVSHRTHRALRLEEGGGLGVVGETRARPDPTGGGEGRAAIIIDDLGRDLEEARPFMELEMPITLAVLPYRRYSRRIAEEARRLGKEVILHLPLEPRGYPCLDPGAGTLLLSMERGEIQAEVAEQIDSLPGCVGVGTHMGSLFMERREPVLWMLSVLRERGLFFVDGMTTPKSMGRSVARDLGVPFVGRTHFLDGGKGEDAVIRQLCRLVDSAVRKGRAVGVAHPSGKILSALPKVKAAFVQKHVRLVPVSGLTAVR